MCETQLKKKVLLHFKQVPILVSLKEEEFLKNFFVVTYLFIYLFIYLIVYSFIYSYLILSHKQM